uniref:Uncharacterized protein n=1 Tax=Rhizophora mucronata TaxID=61149 RepID=A0A2P2JSG8_RHIMU
MNGCERNSIPFEETVSIINLKLLSTTFPKDAWMPEERVGPAPTLIP